MASAAVAPPRPNVVLLVADDMGFNDVSYHGGDLPTPHIDAIAAAGYQFPHAHDPALRVNERTVTQIRSYCVGRMVEPLSLRRLGCCQLSRRASRACDR